MQDHKAQLALRNELLDNIINQIENHMQRLSLQNPERSLLESLLSHIKWIYVNGLGGEIDEQISQLRFLCTQWTDFVDAYKDENETVPSCGRLIRKTISCFQQMNKWQSDGEESKVKKSPTTPPMRSEEELQAQLQIINQKRDRAKQRLSQLEKSPDSEKKQLIDVQKQIEALDAEYNSIKQMLELRKDTTAEMQYMNDWIEAAIQDLDKDKHLDKELASLQKECLCFTIAFFVIVILFLLGYCCFLWRLPSLHLTQWYQYTPYSMSIPIVVALLWIIVYLKNRANKLCIELSSKLFHLRYLEGMMKLCNRTSNSIEEAKDKIEHIVDSLVKTLLTNIENNIQKSEQISNLEKIELKNTPYFKVIEELKQLIKLLKS